MKAESTPVVTQALGKLFVLLIFRKSACAPGAALRTIAYELYRRREKHSSPHHLSRPLFPSFAPSLPRPHFLPSRPLSFHRRPSRALRVLSGRAMFNSQRAVPFLLPFPRPPAFPPSRLPAFPCFRNRQKEAEKVSLIPRVFFRILAKVGAGVSPARTRVLRSPR